MVGLSGSVRPFANGADPVIRSTKMDEIQMAKDYLRLSNVYRKLSKYPAHTALRLRANRSDHFDFSARRTASWGRRLGNLWHTLERTHKHTHTDTLSTRGDKIKAKFTSSLIN